MKSKNSWLLKSLNNPDEFTLTFELVPRRGGRSRELNRTLSLAESIAKDGRFQALSITENAGGHPALTPEVLGAEIQAMGPEVIIHFSCKDKNRNQMESLLFGWDLQNIKNLLVLAGDYPKEGYLGHPKPVFDFDTVHALDMISSMNKGLSLSDTNKFNKEGVTTTSFIKGVVVSPFKTLESELMMQYYKLHRKVFAGADFVITQLGYDARKFHELLLYLKQNDLALPALGNVFIPNLQVAKHMYEGNIPGCVISAPQYKQILHEASSTADKGKNARLLRAGKLLAILKGFGYNGAHIGGPGLTIEDLELVLGEAEGIGENWRDHIDNVSFWPEEAFYYFKKDEKTGLNLHEKNARKTEDSHFNVMYYSSNFIHDHAFKPGGLFYKAVKKSCILLDEAGMQNGLCRFEHIVKAALFGCENCGDCTLSELAYLCPQSGCAKYLLNGACGGSRDGWCEVYPGSKRCLYVNVYERLKKYGLDEKMKEGLVAPRDWLLKNSSSWVNYFQGRDHAARDKKTTDF